MLPLRSARAREADQRRCWLERQLDEPTRESSAAGLCGASPSDKPVIPYEYNCPPCFGPSNEADGDSTPEVRR